MDIQLNGESGTLSGGKRRPRASSSSGMPIVNEEKLIRFQIDAGI